MPDSRRERLALEALRRERAECWRDNSPRQEFGSGCTSWTSRGAEQAVREAENRKAIRDQQDRHDKTKRGKLSLEDMDAIVGIKPLKEKAQERKQNALTADEWNATSPNRKKK